jgi:hypothetical protein
MRSLAGRTRLRRAFVVAAAAFAAIQLVPYGWAHPNPAVTADAPWPSERAAGLARTACYDCHSNEVDWPPHSYVAPMSWLVRRDVDRGREELNFSEWGDDADPDDAAEEVEEGSMPPSQYTAIHGGARLTDAEARTLIAALEQMDSQD